MRISDWSSDVGSSDLRLADVEDVALRLLQHLSPETAAGHDAEPAGDWILIARSLGPAEILDYDRTRLKGLALEEGSATAHVAIVARALDIPVVGRLPNLRSEERRVGKECVRPGRVRG